MKSKGTIPAREVHRGKQWEKRKQAANAARGKQVDHPSLSAKTSGYYR